MFCFARRHCCHRRYCNEDTRRIIPKFEKYLGFVKMVGAIGFEPTTYGSQNRRATSLRYAPTIERPSITSVVQKKRCNPVALTRAFPNRQGLINRWIAHHTANLQPKLFRQPAIDL